MRSIKKTLFWETVKQHTGQQKLQSHALKSIQVNLGLQCNLACQHCHVGASPHRQERMTWPTMEQVLTLVAQSDCQFVDLTGGAPELNPHFRRLISTLRERDISVQVRTNLTVLLEPKLAGISEFLRAHHVQLVASMPCYLEENVDAQRGEGVYKQAISALQKLNNLGYGIEPEHTLNLVYNPGNAKLPPPQNILEADYRRELRQRFGLEFTQLLTLTNMPIGRFRADLRRDGLENEYFDLLHHTFNPDTLEHLMCRHQISIAWDGTLYDCDFNLALSMPIAVPGKNHLEHCNPQALAQRTIMTGNHCLGCTAGCGSSCGGVLTTA